MKLLKKTFYTLLLSSLAFGAECEVKFKDHIVHYADEHNPNNRIITINYNDVKLLELKNIEGDTNHHADVMGELDKAVYMMLVPKGSYFVHFYELKNNKFVKKIRLPFRPRSADAYNKKYNLVLLNSRDRPAGVLIDVKKLKIVGIAGFNIRCSQDKPYPLPIKEVYDKVNNFDPNFKCLPIDFGGDQISGHPIWISSEAFVLIDRANRLLHVYEIKPLKDGKFKTKLVQTIKTDTSLHQLIPESNDEKNRVFYGMTEGNGAKNLVAGVYKFRVSNNRLQELGFIRLRYEDYFGTNGHNLYITPDKKYLYAPAGATLILKDEALDIFGEYSDWVSRLAKYEALKKNYKELVKQFLRDFIDENEILYNYAKVSKLFDKFSKMHSYTPRRVPPFWEYLFMNFYQKNFEFVQTGAVYVVDTKKMRVVAHVKSGKGAGHVAFSEQKKIAIVTNHLDDFMTAINYANHTFIDKVELPFNHENIFNLSQSHMQYVSVDGKYYYNFWSDGGEFFRINLDNLEVDASIYVGGIPIQGNFYEKINTTCDIEPPAAEDGFDEFFGDGNSIIKEGVELIKEGIKELPSLE